MIKAAFTIAEDRSQSKEGAKKTQNA